MRALKPVAIVSMLLSTTAFGATHLQIDPNGAFPDATNTHTLVLTLDNPNGFQVAGYSLKITSATPGALRLITRTNNQVGVLTDATTGQSGVQNKEVGTLLNTVDLGYSGDFDTVEVHTNPVALQTLTLRLEPGVSYPQTISFLIKASNLNLQAETSVASITLGAPEPASMMLLAAGAAFFARRRRIA